MKRKVFVSHSSKDLHAVEEQILNLLDNHALKYWFSKHDLPGGRPWDPSLQEGLAKCEWFLLAMTPQSAASNYVGDEIQWAIDQRQGKILPVLLEKCEINAFGSAITKIQYIDFTEDIGSARKRLLRNLGFEATYQPRKRPAKSFVIHFNCPNCKTRDKSEWSMKSESFIPFLCPNCQTRVQIPTSTCPIPIRSKALKRWLLRGQATLPEHTEQFAEWSNRLDTQLENLSAPKEIVVPLLGSAGSGKSTLLNALLGERVLPSQAKQICTAVVTVIRSADIDGFDAEIQFVTQAEWDKDLREAKLTEEEIASIDNTQAGKMGAREIFLYKLQAVYGLTKEKAAKVLWEDLELPNDLKNYIAEGSHAIHAETAKALQTGLRQFLTSTATSWPLIKRVEIRGRFADLPPGVALVDLPGVNDPNPAREDVTRKFLREATLIWLICNRGVNGDVRRMLSEQKLLRQLLFEGRVHTLAVVVTGKDNVAFDEQAVEELAKEELIENPDCTMQIIRAYGRQSEKQTRRDLEEICEELSEQAEASEEDRKILEQTIGRVGVFLTSAPAYLKLRLQDDAKQYYLEQESDTGIPDLQKYLLEICEAQSFHSQIMRVWEDFDFVVGGAANLLRLQIHAFSKVESEKAKIGLANFAARLYGPLKELDNNFEAACSDARKEIEDGCDSFGITLHAGSTKVKEKGNPLIEAWSRINPSTLRAVLCKAGGPHKNNQGEVYDFNLDIADPLLSATPFVFERFFHEHLEKVLAQLGVEWNDLVNKFFEGFRKCLQDIGSTDDPIVVEIQRAADVCKEKAMALVKDAVRKVREGITAKRQELFGQVPHTVRKMMDPKYSEAFHETGANLTTRRLGILQPHARTKAGKAFDLIEVQLKEGIRELWESVINRFQELRREVVEEATRLIKELENTKKAQMQNNAGVRTRALQTLIDELEMI